MPPKKRLKGAKAQARQPPQPKPTRPTAPEAEGDVDFAGLAKAHWLESVSEGSAIKLENEVVEKELWRRLEADKFSYKSLLALEELQCLENYLLPGYTDDSSNHHVLLIVILANTKRRERLPVWPIFEQRPDEFASLFRRVLSISLEPALDRPTRLQAIAFITLAFQSLDCGIARKECAPLVSIGIWHNLATDARRNAKLEELSQLKKAWRAAAKRYEAADDEAKAKLRFERSWLYTLAMDLLKLISSEQTSADDVRYCESVLELFADLLSQLPTRRYVNTLLHDLHLFPALHLSPVYNDEDNGLLRDMVALLTHYAHFPIDDQTGVQLGPNDVYERHCAQLAKLQTVAIQQFKDKLAVLALSNYGSISKRPELENLLEALTDEELSGLLEALGMRTSYPASLGLSVDRRMSMEVLLSTFEQRRTLQASIGDTAELPTEQTLFEQSVLRTDQYDGSRPLALPKLNLQYLSTADFLWRSLVLVRYESFYGIRSDIEDAIKRLQPETQQGGETVFRGSSKMALPINGVRITEVMPPLVGQDAPAEVKAEVEVDFRRLPLHVRRDWEALRPDDAVFLLTINARAKSETNGGGDHSHAARRLGLVAVRAAEIVRVGDDKPRMPFKDGNKRDAPRPNPGRIRLKLDTRQYSLDASVAGEGDVEMYRQMNIIMRRKGRENNFRPIIASIKSLALSEVPLPSWLREVYLGYGDPAGASYSHLANRLKKIDFRDTFLDWQHLVESFPGRAIEPDDEVSGSFGPPYVLESIQSGEKAPAPKASKKRRRDADPAPAPSAEAFKVSTYKPPNTGPYPQDMPKLNSVRFTPTQVEAIVSGTQPGLTVIVGPPGTGKTDVATQIVSNLYHNFPDQRTLIIAHSNQALNQLFEKIVALDIDERHLLRLGHGEEELETKSKSNSGFGKLGRVESFLENRDCLLLEVSRLAASIGAVGAHGNSAETAGYFKSVYIDPLWARFTEYHTADARTPDDLIHAFPFLGFFENAPQPLFPPGATREEVLSIADGCYAHIAKMFSELADVLPFELLRRDRDRANYLLTAEARIVAMTCTHAAMKRDEIAALGFRYDSVIVEEAGQMTETESFIPLALQKPRPGPNGGNPLQRIVLCGDHLQNSPIVQSLSLRHYANLEQSLFARLVRLGVPTVTLDAQGRARPSIARLYGWRYPALGDLPHVRERDEFLHANAGFKYDYQFVDVGDYKGKGEVEPTPHFIQNLGEAEYAVAIYQYMRLLGYPAEKISILATYAGQKALIRDVLEHRCKAHKVFGMPRIVTTVDKYQGEQNDYIILSLTRTRRVGYLRDIRRLTVAISRARLGLYVLGRRAVFESVPELRGAFDLLLRRPDKLVLASREMWPSKRLVADETGSPAAGDAVVGEVEGEAVMEGVEHLGKYVYDMTLARLGQDAARAVVDESGDGVVEEREDEDEEDRNEEDDRQEGKEDAEDEDADGMDEDKEEAEADEGEEASVDAVEGDEGAQEAVDEEP